MWGFVSMYDDSFISFAGGRFSIPEIKPLSKYKITNRGELVFSENKAYAAQCVWPGPTGILWKLPEEKTIYQYKGCISAISPDGSISFIGGRWGSYGWEDGRSIVVLDTFRKKLIYEKEIQLPIDGIYISPNGKMLVVTQWYFGSNQEQAFDLVFYQVRK